LITFHFDVVFGAYGVNRIFAFVYKVLHVLLELLYVFGLSQFESFELLIDTGKLVIRIRQLLRLATFLFCLRLGRRLEHSLDLLDALLFKTSS
jgi:hypothetical protein